MKRFKNTISNLVHWGNKNDEIYAAMIINAQPRLNRQEGGNRIWHCR